MAQKCYNFPNAPFAKFITDKMPPFNVNDTIDYECGMGYHLRNALLSLRNKYPFFTCTLKDNVAVWDYDSSCVPVNCGHPGHVDNATLIGNDFTFPHSVTFKCDEGYKKTGLDKLYCMPSGDWSTKSIRCEKITCPQLKQLGNGSLTYTNRYRAYASTAHYKCNRGFRLVGNESRTCTEDGTWDGSVPICEKIVCVAENPHLVITPIKQTYEYEDVVLFRCPFTDAVLTCKCLGNGMWSNPLCDDGQTEAKGGKDDANLEKENGTLPKNDEKMDHNIINLNQNSKLPNSPYVNFFSISILLIIFSLLLAITTLKIYY